MNKVILCEGATDAILLSYYLEKTAGWRFSRREPENLSIHASNHNESVNWYKKDGDYLLICGVGGKNNFKEFFETKIKPPLVTANAFEKIAIMTDRDDREISSIEASVASSLKSVIQSVKNREWCSNTFLDSFGIEKTVDVLLLVIPKEQQGALESVMLDAISEDPYNRNIVEKSGIFVKQMRSEAKKYISSERLQLKAHLGVTWAVQYPEKVFSLIDEQIRSVKWEKSEVLHECLGLLEEM